MIGVTSLMCGTMGQGDDVRYGKDNSKVTHHKARIGANIGPVVAWNMTKSCNLRCMHCYMDSENKKYEGELTTEEAKSFIDDLGAFNVPVLLFSGGEPLMRPDLFELAEHAKSKGIRCVISTNGTLITPEVARKIKDTGFVYVGISLDGVKETHDKFRQKEGCFEAALEGVRNCVAVDQNVGLRFTINKHNFRDLPEIFDLIEKEDINRACFYHLVYTGRGSTMQDQDVTRQESREVMDYIMKRAKDFHERGIQKDILTVDNHCDGVYLYMKLLEEDPKRAEEILPLLKFNGGNRSGIGFANVDNLGNVHPDQFSPDHIFGNVKERPFSEIWTDITHPVLSGYKDRKPLMKGRCAICEWWDLCGGNFRTRAEAVHGDLWESDPACYLTDEEISTRK